MESLTAHPKDTDRISWAYRHFWFCLIADSLPGNDLSSLRWFWQLLHINPAKTRASASVKHPLNHVIRSPYSPYWSVTLGSKTTQSPPGVAPCSPPPYMLYNLLFPLHHPAPATTSINLLQCNRAWLCMFHAKLSQTTLQVCGWRSGEGGVAAASTFLTAESDSGNMSVTTLVRRMMRDWR